MMMMKWHNTEQAFCSVWKEAVPPSVLGCEWLLEAFCKPSPQDPLSPLLFCPLLPLPALTAMTHRMLMTCICLRCHPLSWVLNPRIWLPHKHLPLSMLKIELLTFSFWTFFSSFPSATLKVPTSTQWSELENRTWFPMFLSSVHL